MKNGSSNGQFSHKSLRPYVPMFTMNAIEGSSSSTVNNHRFITSLNNRFSYVPVSAAT